MRMIENLVALLRAHLRVVALCFAVFGAIALPVGLYFSADQDERTAAKDVDIAASMARMNADIRDVLTQREQAVTRGAGSIVIVTGADRCVERRFDNATGKVGTAGAVPCDARIDSPKAGLGSNGRMHGLLSTFNK